MASSSWAGYAAPMQQSASTGRSKKAQARQLLSCTNCRQRKVKAGRTSNSRYRCANLTGRQCDRTKPCTACCASGHPKECEFVVGEGNDYSPIQQSYEIRKLRQENLELKKEVQKLQHRMLTHADDDDDTSTERKGTTGLSRDPSTARQKRFKTGDKVDNLYFGTPGLASVVSDFANLQVGAHSLTHTPPRGKDFYASDDQPSYPFLVVEGRSSIAALAAILPESDQLFASIESFQKRAQSCSFPHTPDEVTKKELQRFLDDKAKNAELHPDMLALIFATVATGMQMGQYDRSGGRWDWDNLERTRRTSDALISASMQALRLASFMNRPTVLAIQTLLMMGPYLTNSGRFLDAWTLFGTTIRLAHSIGLHRDPKYLDPIPSLRECTVRQSLWWWMLHLDQQYSVTLGRPLGITGYGDCPPPEPLTTNPTVLRLGEFVDHLTILSRTILSSDGLMSVSKIDEFTDKLVGLWDTMPAVLQFNESWLRPDMTLPEWPLEMMSATLYAQVQSYLVLLNRQRVERTQSYSQRQSQSPPAQSYHTQRTQSTHGSPTHNAPIRGRPLVINSSICIIKAFLFFRYRNPGVLICWSIGQQAFNACMILLLDALESESMTNDWLVEQAFVVFQELEQNGVHRLAELAVQRISEGLVKLGQMRMDAGQQLAMGHRASEPSQPQLNLDPATMTDWSNDTVMGNTGMFLLEDPGLQSYHPQANPFRPLSWTMADTALNAPTSAQPASSTPPHILSPTVPVSQVTAAPFPIMTSPPFVAAGAIPVTNSPYAVGLQPRLTGPQQHHQHRRSGSKHGMPGYRGLPTGSFIPTEAQQHQAFAAVNVGLQYGVQVSHQQQQEQQAYVQRPPQQHSAASSSRRQSAHRVEKTSRSQQRKR